MSEVPYLSTRNVGTPKYSEPTEVLNLAPHPDFSRKDYTGSPIKKLIDVIDYVKPTALLGLSTVKVLHDVTGL